MTVQIISYSLCVIEFLKSRCLENVQDSDQCISDLGVRLNHDKFSELDEYGCVRVCMCAPLSASLYL